MIADCTALILAGGDSSRMGQDKANLLLDGESLLHRVTASMQQLFPRVIVSVREPRAEVALPQVSDAHESGGPLAGLVAGLVQVETDWMFAVACDMPFIQSAVISHMSALRGEQLAVVPMIGGHPQPLFAFYSKQALPVMRAAFESGEKRVRAVLTQLDVRYVYEKELRAYDPQFRSFIDLDTPQDHAAAQELK